MIQDKVTSERNSFVVAVSEVNEMISKLNKHKSDERYVLGSLCVCPTAVFCTVYYDDKCHVGTWVHAR